MNGEDPDTGRPRGPDPRRPHRSSRPLWLGGLPAPRGPGAGPEPPREPGAARDGDIPSDPRRPRGHGFPAEEGEEGGAPGSCDCEECAELGDLDDLLAADAPDPDLGEIVVILLVSTLTGLRDRLERDGFDSAAALVHDLVEVADDYVMRFQP